MAFEHIENLKNRYTDKYVIVDESRPELRRFRGYAGVVKTVNMSGRALVQFDDFENNIGWFDIDVDFLKVLDQPPAKQEKPARAAPAKPTPADKPAAKAAKPAAAAPAAGGGGMSVQDVLAAARGKSASAGAATAPAKPAKEETPTKAEAAKPAGQMSVAEIMAAARAEKAGGAAAAPKAEAKAKPAARPSEESSSLKMETPQAKSPQSMNVAEILAAARAEKAGGGAAPAAPPVEEPAAEEAPKPESAPPPPPAEPAEKAPPGELPTTTADIVAWCRQRDAK